jgi:signal transduction histidine kinase/uncharacterized protein YhfF
MSATPDERGAERRAPRRGPDLLRTVATETAGRTGAAFFPALVRRLAEAFGAEIAFVTELVDAEAGHAVVLASWEDGVELPEGSSFRTRDTPLDAAGEEDVVSIPSGAAARFPRDPLIARHGLDGYLAVVLRGADGAVLGHVGVQASGRLEVDEDERAALSILAARAAGEIERRRHEAVARHREHEAAAARARLVAAADEERRRVGRDLHDGAQQRLVALGHLLTMAERRMPEDPEGAASLVAKAREQARLANEELRELARGLHPAGLVEYGLGHALAALATSSPLPLRLDELPDRRLPEAVETTIFYLVSEGLANAMKHADATEVRVRVRRDGRQLVVDVADDGAGGADPRAGSGLAGLGDRVAALGGTLEVDSPAGRGTRLAAAIPLDLHRSPREPYLEFGYEDDGGLGERLVRLVLEGRKTVSTSLAREWDLEGGPPRIGQRLPVLDGTGRRRATVEVTQVMVVPFSIIDDDVVAAELAAGESADDWRDAQRAFYEGAREELALLLGEPGWHITDDEPMIVTWFEVVEEGADGP